ncbi:MAG: aldehyde dehydrogenase EutE [Verrucomicrobia bacterium]|nr:MAG: aldehyde dehydrogenase EutE [Verrucomicrobiota bacterium]
MAGSSQLNLDESTVRSVVEEVLRNLTRSGGVPIEAPTPSPNRCGRNSRRFGVFEDAAEASRAALDAFHQLKEKGIAGRLKVVEIIKGLCDEKAEEWGRLEFEETRIGRLDHKVEKLQIVKLVPGVEWLKPYGLSGDHGITLEEYTPYGVVGAITPVTHSIPTLSGNVVNIVAAGNAVVFNPHPNGAGCAAVAVRTFNEAIHRELGIENLICAVEKPTLDSFDALCKAPEVSILCVTGGPAVVEAAMKSGKRAICAGPGNPPVLVDDTADIDKAARNIIEGGSYDNNLLCVGEKEIFVLDNVADRFIRAMRLAGAVQLNDGQLARLTAEAFTDSKDAGGCSHPVLNRDLVGKDATDLARIAGATAPAGTDMLFAETDANHPYVMEEQMMPMVPVIRVRSVEEGIELAKKAEHGYRHSSIIHTLNVNHMTAMARALDSTLFIKNGPCTAGLGLGGEGYLSYSIATTTGEGITNPKTFTRTRRCVMVDNLRIY